MENKELALTLQIMKDTLKYLYLLSAENGDKYLDEIAEIEIALTKIELQEGI